MRTAINSDTHGVAVSDPRAATRLAASTYDGGATALGSVARRDGVRITRVVPDLLIVSGLRVVTGAQQPGGAGINREAQRLSVL